MPVTRSQSQPKPANPHAESVKWAVENGPLPKSDLETSSSASPANNTLSALEEAVEPSTTGKQARNAKNPHWPFLAKSCKPTAVWDALTVKMLEDSTRQGSVINCTGAACRARFKRLVKGHKNDETHSLQKTGTNEEVDDHIKTMTDLVALVNGHEASKEEFLDTMKKQQALQQKAALQMHDAVMKGRVPRNTLTDVAQLDGATVREKQGQRKQKLASSGPSDSDKVNIHPGVNRPHHQSALERVLIQHEETDQKQLEDACIQYEHRHQEI
ncbi:hypothetical protein M422DRAFT_259898 [Sphaerobolus stellatus SS14]|uniref:Myb-like domain-containing protein n=1 Tax=Sphaerobolus stellatus (strain SS14) TaxID=990650 RepID=A0A0C9V7K3_SPHS4|nr:hypothetical protein M422DRAFT_259898 [Sphaerobolus stellatus SS14]